MYIKKYWGNFIGGSDDSLNLVAFLEDQKKEEIPLSEIFAKIGLDVYKRQDEYCIFLKNLTEAELAQITSLDGTPLDMNCLLYTSWTLISLRK